jgi:hypothetical protein
VDGRVSGGGRGRVQRDLEMRQEPSQPQSDSSRSPLGPNCVGDGGDLPDPRSRRKLRTGKRSGIGMDGEGD